MSKIGLWSDCHNFPSLPLMKLSAYHKQKGDTVEMLNHLVHYDLVYCSKTFSFTPDAETNGIIQADEIIRGGTGYCISIVDGKEVFNKSKDVELPKEIEHIYPDYSLYPNYNYAVGFLTRGCPRGCGFCIVGCKEGLCSRQVADLSEFWREQKEIAKILEPYIKTINEQHKSVGKKKIYVLDTETTGLNPDTDELLQISIIDFNGKTIFNSYIKPIASEWKKAEQINGITPEMVKNSPSVADVMTDINLIFSQADIIIGYNTSFDLSFLRAFGLVLIDNITIIDVMELFAPIYGEWNESYGQYKWQKLTKCAAYYEYDWGNDKAHNSLSDCRATLFCYNQIVKEKDCGE